MYVKHNFQVFQCVGTLLKDSYIDCTNKNEAIIESKIALRGHRLGYLVSLFYGRGLASFGDLYSYVLSAS